MKTFKTVDKRVREEIATWTDVVIDPSVERAIAVAVFGNLSILFIGSPMAERIAALTVQANWGTESSPQKITARGMLCCPCGNLWSPTRLCLCSAEAIAEHRITVLQAARHFDMMVEVRDSDYDEVVEVLSKQGIYNKVEPVGQDILRAAYDKIGLLPDALFKVLKIAEQIALSAGSTDKIRAEHVAEAVQYRNILDIVRR